MDQKRHLLDLKANELLLATIITTKMIHKSTSTSPVGIINTTHNQTNDGVVPKSNSTYPVSSPNKTPVAKGSENDSAPSC